MLLHDPNLKKKTSLVRYRTFLINTHIFLPSLDLQAKTLYEYFEHFNKI